MERSYEYIIGELEIVKQELHRTNKLFVKRKACHENGQGAQFRIF